MLKLEQLCIRSWLGRIRNAEMSINMKEIYDIQSNQLGIHEMIRKICISDEFTQSESEFKNCLNTFLRCPGQKIRILKNT